MQILRLYLIFIILSLIIVSGCICPYWSTESSYKTPPNTTVDRSNVTVMINEEWNKTYGNTGITVDNSSIQFYGYMANVYESFKFNTTDRKSTRLNSSHVRISY